MPDEFEAFPMSALYLPGTVALPSPFPTVGRVWLPSPDFECMPGLLKKHHLHLLAIGNLVPPSRSIVRYVRVEHISAMFLLAGKGDADETEAVNWNQGKWLYAPSLEDLKGQLKPKSRAIVYVPENAPVMTQTVFGTTAAESAEYIHAFRTSCDP
jgi:hypothetical protein